MKDIYDYLNGVIKDDTKPAFFFDKIDRLIKEKDDIKNNSLLKVILKMTHIYIDLKNYIINFGTFIDFNDGHTFKIEDIDDEFVKVLETIEVKRLPLSLKAFICHIIWEKRHKDHKEYAKLAIDSYVEIFQKNVEKDNSDLSIFDKRNIITFALQLAISINEIDKINECFKQINSAVLNEKVNYMLAIELIDVLKINRHFDNLKEIINRIDKIKPIYDEHKIKILKTKISLLDAANCPDLLKYTVLELIEFYRTKIDYLNDTGNFITINFIKEIIFLARKYNINEIDINELMVKMLTVQKLFKENNLYLNITSTGWLYEFIFDKINNFTDKMSIKEFFISLTYFIQFYSKTQIIHDLKNNPSIANSLLEQLFLDSNGMITSSLSPFDSSNIKEEQIYTKIKSKQEIDGFILYKIIHNFKKTHINFTKNDFDYIVDYNLIIPKNRTDIIKTALYLFFNDKIYEATHILIPQFENILRNLLNLNGCKSISLKDDLSERVLLLSSILNDLQRNKVLSEDKYICLNSLLNNQSGANLRNRTCHGFFNPEDAKNPICVYFFCMVLKILVDNSDNCKKIILSSSMLGAFKKFICNPVKNISVAMTTYNGELYLKEQLDSIINQTFKPYEIVIVDDCSTDNTYKILEDYSNKYSFIHIYRNKHNLGFNSNFYRAISLCKGDYIALSDQDDIWFSEKLDKLYENIILLDNNKPSLVSSRCIEVDKNKKVIKDMSCKDSEGFISAILTPYNHQGSSFLFNRKLADDLLKTNPDNNKICFDLHISWFAACFGNIKMLGIPLMYYRRHENNAIGVIKVKYNLIERIKWQPNIVGILPYYHVKSLNIFYYLFKDTLQDETKQFIKDLLSIYNTNSFLRSLKLLMQNKHIRIKQKFKCILFSLIVRICKLGIQHVK